MKKWQKRTLVAVIALLVVLGVGAFVLHQQTYQPSTTAQKANSAAKATAYGEYFASDDPVGPTVIFYPGALVAPASYSVWAKQLADAGYPVAIVKMPLNLAVLGGEHAAKVPVDQRGYVIGGHSLGGVMAARYAVKHASTTLRGVYFMASYPDQKGDLHDRQLPVLSLTASRDGVLNQTAWTKAKAYLPKDTRFEELQGGDHAGFGSYGAQRGDQAATIKNALQQTWIAAQMSDWLNDL